MRSRIASKFLWLLSFAFPADARFLSRPDLHPLPLHVQKNELPADDNDVIFIAPYESTQDGPVIYTIDGELVWDGVERSTSDIHPRANNFHPIQLHGKPHLAYAKMQEDIQSRARRISYVILNSSYQVVAEYGDSVDSSILLNAHDVELLDNDTAILQVMSRTYETEGDGRIVEAVLQELNLEDNEVVFEWRSLEHVHHADTCISMQNQDYFHMNSAHKDSSGNYLVNGYNVCGAYYINGTTGSNIWSLGGQPNSTFRILDEQGRDTTLRHMHHLRFQPSSSIRLPSRLQNQKTHIPTSSHHLAISLFDNAFDASFLSPPTAASSSAIILLLDLRLRTATIVERYPHPGGALAAMFGSFVLLPNGDRFIGWGSARDISQHASSDGRTVFHAELGDSDSLIGSYRAFKAPWVGRPTTSPDVYAYAWGCGWRVAVYVSWNGATEVAGWRVYGGDDGMMEGAFVRIGGGEKRGFETRFRAEEFVRWVFVEAVSGDGEVLGRSGVVETAVPPPVEARGCSEWKCPATLTMPRYDCFTEYTEDGVPWENVEDLFTVQEDG